MAAAARFLVSIFFGRTTSDSNAVVNVKTSLVLNGICSIGAGKGIFSGDSAYLYVSDWLGLAEIGISHPLRPCSNTPNIIICCSFKSRAGESLVILTARRRFLRSLLLISATTFLPSLLGPSP